MKRSLLGLTITTLLTTPLAVSAHMTDAEIDEKIKEFILNNPSVMVKSLNAAEKRAKDREEQKRRQMVVDLHEPLFENPDSPSYGSDDPDITIVEFFDYNCGACKMMFRGLELTLLQDKKVRVIFKEYPIFGEQSDRLAAIGQAVHKVAPDQYYDFHKKMMRHQGGIDDATAYGYIRSLGINAQKVEKAANSVDIKTVVDETIKLARSLEVKGTPTLIVGDELVPHALNADGLNSKIDAYRSRQ